MNFRLKVMFGGKSSKFPNFKLEFMQNQFYSRTHEHVKILFYVSKITFVSDKMNPKHALIPSTDLSFPEFKKKKDYITKCSSNSS